jgi:hypothetical protein
MIEHADLISLLRDARDKLDIADGIVDPYEDGERFSADLVKEIDELIDDLSRELKESVILHGRTDPGLQVPFVLKDESDKGAEDKRGRVVFEPAGITLLVEGYGDACSDDGKGTPVLIENWEGELRVILWNDINQEEASHRVSLEDAREDKRKD